MAKKWFHVVEYSQYSVTIKQEGIHLSPEVVTLQRAAIVSVTRKLTGLVVATSGGRQYDVREGSQTAEAFGIRP